MQSCCFHNFIWLLLTTDVSGGHSPSMLEAIRQCITASTVMAFSKSDSYKPLTHKDAFKLATLGGSEGMVTNKLPNLTSYTPFTPTKHV